MRKVTIILSVLTLLAFATSCGQTAKDSTTRQPIKSSWDTSSKEDVSPISATPQTENYRDEDSMNLASLDPSMIESEPKSHNLEDEESKESSQLEEPISAITQPKDISSINADSYLSDGIFDMDAFMNDIGCNEYVKVKYLDVNPLAVYKGTYRGQDYYILANGYNVGIYYDYDNYGYICSFSDIVNAEPKIKIRFQDRLGRGETSYEFYKNILAIVKYYMSTPIEEIDVENLPFPNPDYQFCVSITAYTGKVQFDDDGNFNKISGDADLDASYLSSTDPRNPKNQ